MLMVAHVVDTMGKYPHLVHLFSMDTRYSHLKCQGGSDINLSINVKWN